MKELLEKIEKKYGFKVEELKQSHETVAEFRTELKLAQNKIVQLQSELDEVKKRWSKFQKLIKEN